eukprot:gene16868-8343_t
MPPKKRTNRYNVKCLECGSVFEFDYSGKHNTIYHEDLKRMNKVTRYEVEGAAKNPFEAAERAKSCGVEIKEKEENIPSTSHSSPIRTDEEQGSSKPCVLDYSNKRKQLEESESWF